MHPRTPPPPHLLRVLFFRLGVKVPLATRILNPACMLRCTVALLQSTAQWKFEPLPVGAYVYSHVSYERFYA